MQARKLRIFAVAAVLLMMVAPPAQAEDAVIIEIGDTGLYLPNNAYSQDKHYLKQDSDLMGRIACLMQDVDCLLAELHALPPELEGQAVTQPATASELAGLIELALNNNPELEPYRSKLAMQAAMTRQAGAKPDPMVMFNFAAFPLPDFSATDVPMTQYVLGWSQKYISYGKRDLKRSIASLSEDLTQLELSQNELDIIQQLTDLYFKAASTKARLRVLDDNIELLNLLVELAERKYALGRTPQALVLQAQTQLSKLQERRITLDNLLKRQMEMMRGLVGHASEFDPDQLKLSIDYAVLSPVDFDVDGLLAATLDERPDYQQLDVQTQQQQLQVELAHRAYRPDYTVSASYGLRYGKRDFFSAGISIPVFTHKAEKQDAALQQAYASLDMTDSMRHKMENMLATQLATQKVDLDRIVEVGGLYRDGLVPQARLTLDSTIAGYAANRVDLSDLLKSQQMLLDYELELEQLSIDYLAGLSQLQVLTAGAFDPLPYLTPDLSGGASSAVTIPQDVQQQFNEEQPAPSAPSAAPGEQQQPAGGGQPPLIGPSFLEGLGLPQPAPQPEDGTAPQTQGDAGESQSQDEAAPPADDAATGEATPTDGQAQEAESADEQPADAQPAAEQSGDEQPPADETESQEQDGDDSFYKPFVPSS